MPYVIGQPIRVVVTWGTPGQTLERDSSSIAGTDTVWNPTVTDLDDDFGRHELTYTPSVAGLHRWIGETSDGIPVTLGWDVLTAAQADPEAALAAAIAALPTTSDITTALSGYSVTVVSPIATSGLVTIKRGDWYSADDDRALEWVDENDNWPDLTDALITFAAKPNTLRKSTDFILVTGSVVVPTGEGKTIRVELTTPDTEGKTPGKWTYDVQAVTSPDGHNVTLVSGPMVLEEDFVP